MSVFFQSCKERQQQEDKRVFSSTENNLIGKKINPMSYAVIPYYQIDSSELRKLLEKPYKIFVYGNFYCGFCWHNFLKWKNYYSEFKNYKNLAILFYLHATPEDFEKYKLEDSVNFPVILDYRDRFRVVNSISDIPREHTFMVDRNNKIIAVGQPFDLKTRAIYLNLIKRKE
jgi:hypothetical protein